MSRPESGQGTHTLLRRIRRPGVPGEVMDMKRFRRRTWIVLGVLVVAAVAAVSGYAYFSAAGSGTGAAVVGGTSGIVIQNQTPSGIWPDSAWHSFDVYVTNNGAGPQHIGTITGTVQDQGGCSGTWFDVYPIVVNATVPTGTTTLTGAGGSAIRMNDNGYDQSACQGLTLQINWSSN